MTESLPLPPPPTRGWMRRFEIRVSQPLGLSILHQELGVGRTLKLSFYLLSRQLRGDPFAVLPPLASDDIEGWLARRQLGPVIHLTDALVTDLGLEEAEALRIVGRIVSETGATLLASLFPDLDPAEWSAAPEAERENMVRQIFRRFGNIAAADVTVGEDHVRFDVLTCRFAAMTRELGRPELAPLFCAADAVFFSRPDTPYGFARTGTLAGGADACDFHITFTGPIDHPDPDGDGGDG